MHLVHISDGENKSFYLQRKKFIYFLGDTLLSLFFQIIYFLDFKFFRNSSRRRKNYVYVFLLSKGK